MYFIQKLTTIYKAFKSRVTKSIWWRERAYTKYMDFVNIKQKKVVKYYTPFSTLETFVAFMGAAL